MFLLLYVLPPPSLLFFFNIHDFSCKIDEEISREYVCYNLCVCIHKISGSSSNVVKIYEKKHSFVSDFIRGPYNYDLFDDYAMWLREGLLVRHMNK